MVANQISVNQVLAEINDIHRLNSVLIALSDNGKRALAKHIRQALWKDAELRSHMQNAVALVEKQASEIDQWLEEQEASLFAHHDALSKESDPAYWLDPAQ